MPQSRAMNERMVTAIIDIYRYHKCQNIDKYLKINNCRV